jgi:hypothetical protein
MQSTKVARPKQVKIGPYIFEIRYVPNSEMQDCGEVDKVFLWIKIKDDVPEQQQKVTLLHEILHAISSVWDGGRSDEHTEEEFCQRTSALLYDVLANDPQVRQWLFDK